MLGLVRKKDYDSLVKSVEHNNERLCKVENKIHYLIRENYPCVHRDVKHRFLYYVGCQYTCKLRTELGVDDRINLWDDCVGCKKISKPVPIVPEVDHTKMERE